MNLSALRQALVIPIEPADPELFAEMWQAVQALGNGRFLPVMHELLQRYEQGAAIRPRFPNKMQSSTCATDRPSPLRSSRNYYPLPIRPDGRLAQPLMRPAAPVFNCPKPSPVRFKSRKNLSMAVRKLWWPRNTLPFIAPMNVPTVMVCPTWG